MSVTMAKTKLFMSNRSQAVRLPKDVAFPEGVSEVRVIVEGKSRRIVPVDALWEDFFSSPGIADWPDREPQGEWPEREAW